ncbi:hypothetical protein E9K_07652 [Moraxella catarrhalis 103P14B1]|nr:hypothetical protein E9K_07652 [Moraxella catarrhalis 103P14B1]
MKHKPPMYELEVTVLVLMIIIFLVWVILGAVSHG